MARSGALDQIVGWAVEMHSDRKCQDEGTLKRDSFVEVITGMNRQLFNGSWDVIFSA